jgi:hypothetical protein
MGGELCLKLACHTPHARQHTHIRSQVSKLLIIPFVCIVEGVWHRRRYTIWVLCSIFLVVIGVAVV